MSRVLSLPTPPEYSGTADELFFLGTDFIGKRTQYCCGLMDSGREYSAFWPNTAYFCSHCGEIWARRVMKFNFTYTPKVTKRWVIRERHCATHGDGRLLDSLIGADTALLTHDLVASRPEHFHANYLI